MADLRLADGQLRRVRIVQVVGRPEWQDTLIGIWPEPRRRDDVEWRLPSF